MIFEESVDDLSKQFHSRRFVYLLVGEIHPPNLRLEIKPAEYINRIHVHALEKTKIYLHAIILLPSYWLYRHMWVVLCRKGTI